MHKNWISCTVQDLIRKGEAELKTGPFGTQLHASDYINEGTPVINVRNIGLGDIRTEKLEFISEETVRRLKSHLLEMDDIVFGRKGAVERHVFIKKQQAGWFQGSDCLRLRLKSPLVDSRFISFCLLTEFHKRWIVNQCSHGSTMTSLNQEIISRIPLYLPPISTQRKIASILSAYDDLIENNTRRIAILEEMARSLYQEWFVHFRFPGHEKNRMVESELGIIPEGWEVKTIDELLEYHVGGGWGQEKASDGYMHPAYVIRGTDIPSARYISINNCPLRFHKKSNLESRKLQFKDVVFEVSGGSKGQPVGRSLLVSQQLLNAFNEDVICASFCKLLRVDQKVILPDLFCLHLLEIYEDRRIEKYQVQSTGITNFKFAYFLDSELVITPPLALQKEFSEATTPIFELIQTVGAKNTNLRRTRDLLLPKLISGEIDVEALETEGVTV